MKRRRRRERVRAIKGSAAPKGEMIVRRRGVKKKVQPTEPPVINTRTVYHMTYMPQPKWESAQQIYRLPTRPPQPDTEAAMVLMNFGVIGRETVHEITTSRLCTPNMSVMIENIMRFDAPDIPPDVEDGRYMALAVATSYNDEIVERCVRFQSDAFPTLSSDVMASFAGLYYDRIDRHTKGDAEGLVLAEARGARERIMRQDKVFRRPCCLFGRGKIVRGLEPGQPVGAAGRLVMAPDVRDHLIMVPEANAMKEVMTGRWKTSHLSLGLSFPNGGGAMWSANLIADLVGMPRVGPESDPPYANHRTALRINNWFLKHETNYRYMVLDISKQDTTVSRTAINDYFDAVFNIHQSQGSNLKRLSRLVNWARFYHLETTFCLPDGQKWKKHRGNVSGSPHTTLINSWTQNNIVRATLLFIFNGRIPPGVTWRVYGDNTIIAYHHKFSDRLTLENVRDIMEDMFDAKMNVDESRDCYNLFMDNARNYEDVAIFLGKRLYTNGLTWRPAYESLVAIVHPDSNDLSLNTRYARANGLAMDNPGNSEAQLAIQDYLDYLESRGAVMTALPNREMNKFRYGRGVSEEWINIPWRMKLQDIQNLYLTPRNDPCRNVFKSALMYMPPPVDDPEIMAMFHLDGVTFNADEQGELAESQQGNGIVGRFISTLSAMVHRANTD
jgi:hypothetical protein